MKSWSEKIQLPAPLRDARPVVTPGIYDGYSARLVQKMGFKTAATTGAGLTNSLIVQPDIGIFGLRDNVDACRHLARSVDIPLTADADTGYGNAVTVYHVVQYFEEAGIVGVNIEDQVMPKRCGHMRGKELISVGEMTKKIEAGLKAKKDQDFIINARTDAIAVEDIAGTVKRVKAYSKAGTDMIYVDAIRGEDDIARVVEAAGDTPININMGFFIRQRPTSPLLPLKRLKELGVARVSSPRMLTSAAISGMRKALEVMQQCMITGELADRPDLTASMEEITELFDYEKIAALESAFSVEEDLERKYRDKERSYVVRSGTKQ